MDCQKGANSEPIPYKPCRLYHFDYSTRKPWRLVYSQWNVKTGQLHRRHFTGFNNIPDVKLRLKEARHWERFINEQLVSGKVYNPDLTKAAPTPVVAPALPTFADDFAAFTAAKSATLSSDTIDAYNTFFWWWERYMEQVSINHLLTVEITPALCQGYQDFLINHNVTDKEPLAPKTINNYVGTLKAVLNYYCKPARKRFEVSPALHVDNLPVESEPDEPFSPEQAAAVLAEIEKREEWQLLLFVYLIHYTFARPGKEIRFLRVRDIRERTIVYKVSNVKSNAQKAPTIPKPLLELIDRLGIRDHDPELFVFSRSGKPGTKAVGNVYFWRKHRAVLDHLNIVGKYTLYSWKYTGNIKLFNTGINLKNIQMQNGHTTLRTTEKYLKRLGQFVDNDIFEKFV
ncbi:tyrosine-type recombinase/integrase [Fibrella aquatilis]|uniref:Phage integrase SAM-like domain-containing protein n=1 Tax=Fibrella aquatilis TaxID=2817059 RepID=A0A939GBQ3_9BACT|nr:site-specific integrase [Fibrella aquatilis]MBO0934610.1 phage integrase SAM-like domain-containing protein [Fibrella aquatilis]